MYVSEHALESNFVIQMLAPNMHQKGLKYFFISQKA